MSEPRKPLPAKLVVSIIFRAGIRTGNTPELLETLAQLEQKFGPTDYVSHLMEFKHTKYYNNEMGDFLLRRFISFKQLVCRDRLAEIKLYTNSVEKKYCDRGGLRKVNIDPGLLSLENLVLASGKNFTHRIYLQNGIFAEVTLLYQNKKFTTMDWTYPDYASMEITAILTDIRSLLVADLKNPDQLIG